MSYIIISASDIHFGPTTISSEDGRLHEQLVEQLTFSTKLPKSKKEVSGNYFSIETH